MDQKARGQGPGEWQPNIHVTTAGTSTTLALKVLASKELQNVPLTEDFLSVPQSVYTFYFNSHRILLFE